MEIDHEAHKPFTRTCECPRTFPGIRRTFTAVVAMDLLGGIGFKGNLLKRIPEDLKRFKEITTGHTVVMGRKTFESLPKGALPNRTNIVISRTKDALPGCKCMTLEAFLKEYTHKSNIFVIGGGEIYRELLPYTKLVKLTYIHDEFEADTFFPPVGHWKSTNIETLEDVTYIDLEYQGEENEVRV